MLAGKAAVVQINTDENPGLSARYGVQGIPALFLLRDGKIVDKLTGAQTAEAIIDWFKQQIRD